MFYSISLTAGDKRQVIRHVRTSRKMATTLAEQLARIYGAEGFIISKITDPKILATLIARIATLCLILSLQVISSMAVDDQTLNRSNRGSRIIRPSRTPRRTENHV